MLLGTIYGASVSKTIRKGPVEASPDDSEDRAIISWMTAEVFAFVVYVITPFGQKFSASDGIIKYFAHPLYRCTG